MDGVRVNLSSSQKLRAAIARTVFDGDGFDYNLRPVAVVRFMAFDCYLALSIGEILLGLPVSKIDS